MDFMALEFSPMRLSIPGQKASNDWKTGIVTDPCVMDTQKYQSSCLEYCSTASCPAL